MVRISVALLALPAAALDMENPSLHDQHWDMSSINHLMDSTTKLIQHSVTTKVTPTIQRFAQATIEKIDSDVLPALEEEHKSTKDLLEQELARFQDVRTSIESKKAEIASKDEECSRYTTTHEQCRDEEHTVTTEVIECESHSTTKISELTTCEETIKITEGDMESLWCEEAFDALSSDFYHNSVSTMKKYIERKQKCAKIREEINSHTPECETKTVEKTETRTRCNTEQRHLEECTCERANLVEHWTDHFSLEWQNLTSAYEDLAKESQATALERIKEFKGLHIVKCLLDKIVVIGQTDEPCNESHVEKVTMEVKACHEEEHDATHLELNPEPAPELPPLYDHAPYPCGADFIALHYSHLPADAGAEACDSHYCLPKLVDATTDPVVHR
jgi:hypothetical protein